LLRGCWQQWGCQIRLCSLLVCPNPTDVCCCGRCFTMTPNFGNGLWHTGSCRVEVNDISINVLELLGMVVGALVLITQQQYVPQALGDCVQLRRDNEASVAWIQRCRGGKEPRSGAIMRMLEVVEVSSGWLFQSSHVPGVLNSTADGTSRWHPHDIYANLCAAASHLG